MSRLFHVSSVANRDSILAHGLDWTRMGAAHGIAGSTAPEAEGVFLCDEFEVQFFTGINNTGGPVDVWVVTGIEERQMVETSSGFSYYPGKIPPGQVALIELPPDDSGLGLGRWPAKRKKTNRISSVRARHDQ